MLEDLGVGVGREVAVLLAGRDVREHDAIEQLAQALLALLGADRATEVLRGDDRGRVDAPEVGELDAALLEDLLAGPPVGLYDVAALPRDVVVRVDALGGVDALDREALAGLLVVVPAVGPSTVSVIPVLLFCGGVGGLLGQNSWITRVACLSSCRRRRP